MCTARALYTRLAEQVGRAALKLLEVVPGMSVWELLMRDWEGRDVNQIGRQPPLSSNKATSHFPRLREATGGALGGKQPPRGYGQLARSASVCLGQSRSASANWQMSSGWLAMPDTSSTQAWRTIACSFSTTATGKYPVVGQ